MERTSRFTVVLALPEAKSADGLADVLIDYVSGMPKLVRRSLTWDQGTEMARHVALTLATELPVFFAHWCTILVSVIREGLLMHPWSPSGRRHVRSTFEVQDEFCEARRPRTSRPATGLCADERRSVSDRLRGPWTTGCSPTAATARKQL